MTDVAPLRKVLAEAGDRLVQANQERAAALEAIGAAMREGQGSLSITEMADLAGVTRVTAYRMLDK